MNNYEAYRYNFEKARKDYIEACTRYGKYSYKALYNQHRMEEYRRKMDQYKKHA